VRGECSALKCDRPAVADRWKILCETHSKALSGIDNGNVKAADLSNAELEAIVAYNMISLTSDIARGGGHSDEVATRLMVGFMSSVAEMEKRGLMP